MIGAYITDVERQEEQFLAGDGREGAGRKPASGAGSPAPPGPAEAGEAAANMFQAGEGRWGSGGVRDHRRRA